jgi:hypothetical protein
MDQKKEDYRKYLEKNGVVDALTKGIDTIIKSVQFYTKQHWLDSTKSQKNQKAHWNI